jgi:hypothetical protein
MTEEICGRFGSFRWTKLAYRLARGLCPDDVSVSFTVLYGLRSLGTMCIGQSDLWLRLEADVQRFERQGQRRKVLST